MKNTMRVISSTYQGRQSYSMIPTMLECPYNEVNFIPVDNVLVVIAKELRSMYQFIPKVNDFGEPLTAAGLIDPNSANGMPQQRTRTERVLLDSCWEYVITNQLEILGFIDDVAEESITKEMFKEFVKNSFPVSETPKEPSIKDPNLTIVK